MDAATIKQAAAGRWVDILAAAGIAAELLDGKGHPCPKCNGEDRFAAQRDVATRGAVICRGCFATDCGDGLAAVQWIRGIDFSAALAWVADHLGLQPQRNGKARIVATYDYRDEHGELLMQSVRFEPKDFKQRRPDGKGGWAWRVKGARVVPYRLPELLADAAATVYVAEGEKDCDALAGIGLVAT
jgi:hypothetical protein